MRSVCCIFLFQALSLITHIFDQYDVNSTGPPPPSSVLILNISPLTPNQTIRRHFSAYGTILSFEPQIDSTNGAALGIVLIKFSSHEEAKKCVEKENGRKAGQGMGGAAGIGIGNTPSQGPGTAEEELRVVFDGEGKKLAAVMRELDRRKRIKMEEKRRREKGMLKEGGGGGGVVVKGTPSTVGGGSASQTPVQSGHWRHGHPGSSSSRQPTRPQQSPNPSSSTATAATSTSTANHHHSHTRGESGKTEYHSRSAVAAARRPPPSLVRARASLAMSLKSSNSSSSTTMTATSLTTGLGAAGLPPRPSFATTHSSSSSSSTPVHVRGRRPYSSTHLDDRDRDRDRDFIHQDSPYTISRSPSPISRRPGYLRASGGRRGGRQGGREGERVVEELVKNGFDHVKVEGYGGVLVGGTVREDDVWRFFDGFKVDKVRFRGGLSSIVIVLLLISFHLSLVFN